ncbi:nucleolar protein dao-5-like [Periophthalmus magnuspinnatus]|uniref:nucleolar protein dao-5-like n=1 Tax=Periophthalmus magnuspinnatus TaxID=409849 RepID=UPI00145A4A5C|nr:nucleolar protein dao-5-like [Periophthalmus magnuspinnatus]
MELPLGGPALRHYTQSRPRPHRQKLNYRPTRLQETIIECENEDFELMGRVDEGVEEFFTKKVLPTETLKKEDDDEEEIITVHEVAPASTAPCPPPTKTLRRKLGDFFTLRKRRGLKSEPSQEGRPKKASIADFIRPLREVARGEKDKDKDKVKEHDKENEKEKNKDGVDTVEAVQGMPISDAPPMRGEAVPPRRALREGKSQSLILLSGSASGASRNKKLDGQNSFEQKLHLMLQRIGVSKPQPGEAQNQEGEMKKADSEGTIIDNKPEPTSTKPRTMSASSDTRHQLRSSVSAHESAGKPPLLPKPVIKPGPNATISGRNTPENELGQIEGEPNALSSKRTETALAVSANSTLTISDTVPDSATVLPSSKTDTQVCTESTVEAIAPANEAESDSTVIPEASPTTTAESPSPILEKALKCIPSPSTPSQECDTSTLIETSTVTTPSNFTLEPVVLEITPSDDNSKTTEDISTKLSVPEPNATVIHTTLDTAPASTSIPHIPAGQSENIAMTESDESTPCILPITQADSAIITHEGKTTTSEDPSLSDCLIIVTPTIAADSTFVSTMASSALPEPLSTTSVAAKSEIPASPTGTISPSTIIHTTTVSQAPIPVTSIITIATEVTDTSQNTTGSTTGSPPMATSEPPPSTAINSITLDVSATDNENVTADLTTVSDEYSDQKHELKSSPPEASMTEDAENFTAEKVRDVVQITEETNTIEIKKKSESSKESEKITEELTVISGDIIQDSEEKSKEETVKTNGTAVAEIEAANRAADKLSGSEKMNEKQQEITSTDEK